MEKEAKEQFASTNQIWYNTDKGKYFLVDGSGKPVVCNNGGQPMPRYNPMLTGYASFNQRSQYLAQVASQDIEKEVQLKAQRKSLKFLKDPPKLYLPQINKFEGYVQFRCPLLCKVNDYDSDYKLEIRNIKKKPSAQNSLNTSHQDLKPIESVSPRPLQKSFLSKKTISALYQSYKDKPAIDYMHQQRKSAFMKEQQNKVLDTYAQYLVKGEKKRLKSLHLSPQLLRLDETKGSAQIIRDASPNILKDTSVGLRPQRKIAELSLKIINYQEKDQDLREPPPQSYSILKPGVQGMTWSKRSSSQVILKQKPVNDTLGSTIQQRSTISNIRDSINFQTLNSSQKFLGTQTFQQSTFYDKTLSPYQENSPTLKKKRYANYHEIKAERNLEHAVEDYTQLKKRDMNTLQSFLTSPRLEFEKELKDARSSQIFTLDPDLDQNPTFFRPKDYSVSPRVKSVIDMGSPFSLVEVRDPKAEEKQKLKMINLLKSQTTGLFNEAIQGIRDPGQHWSVDRNQLIGLNPHAQMLMKKHSELDMKRMKIKKESKRLQAMACEQDLKVLERKIYKQYIKY